MTKKPILYSRLKSEKKRQRPFMGRWGKTGWQGKMGTLPKQISSATRKSIFTPSGGI